MGFLYTFIVYPLLFLGFFVVSLFNKKVALGFKLRRNRAWIKDVKDSDSWVWFHVASGELEYAKPVMRALKSLPGFNRKILVTYFSPSVLSSLEKTKEVDLFVPMPWDTPWAWQGFLDHYKPQALAIARTDTWPNMVWETNKKKIPSLLFSATLPNHSARVASIFGRVFYGNLAEHLTHISCVSEEDGHNFQRLSDSVKTTVDGDTRFDQVISRVSEKRSINPVLENIKKPALVLGSTWPEDEEVLLPALSHLQSKFSFLTIIAPHEPTPVHLSELKEKFSALKMKFKLYSELAGEKSLPSDVNVVIIDQVGILADLYRVAQWAFIGGSFKKSVHSVMEAAASGCYSFFGPFYLNNREAIMLRRYDMAAELGNTTDIEKLLTRELSLPQDELLARREKILHFVHGNQGVSVKIAHWINRPAGHEFSL